MPYNTNKGDEIIIDFSNYRKILKYIIYFLRQHPDTKYCIPLGETKALIAKGKKPQLLEAESLNSLSHSHAVKYMHYTPMHWDADQDYLVYVFMVMDNSPVMYAKYAVHDKSHQVFFLGWHASTRPNDKRFNWLIGR